MSLNKAVGIYCRTCESMNDMNSLLYRDSGGVTGQGMRLKCGRGHSVPYEATTGWRKQQLVVVEKQPVGSIVQPVWMMPEVISALQLRYPQNFHTTMCSLMTALADGDTIIVEGEHVREMRGLQASLPDAHPLEKGRDVVGLARENASLRSAVNELQEQVRNSKSQPTSATGGGADHALLLAMAEKLGMVLPGQPMQQPAQSTIAHESVDYVEGMTDFMAEPNMGQQQPQQTGMRGIPVPMPGRGR